MSAAPPTTTTEAPYPTPLPSTRILPGVLTSPAAPARGHILLLHGMASHHDHSFAPALAAHLSAALGVHVLRYTSRGPAPSPLEPSHRFRISGAATDDCQDLHAVVQHCAAGAALGPLLALVGHSRGANVVLFYAAAQGLRIPLVALSPRHFLPAMLASRIFSDAQRAALASGADIVWPNKAAGDIVVTPGDAQELEALGTMAPTLAALPPAARLLVCHGTADATIPHGDSEALVAAARPGAATLALFAKAPHNYKGAEAALFEAITGFLVGQLGPLPA